MKFLYCALLVLILGSLSNIHAQPPGTVKSYHLVNVAPGTPLADSPGLWLYGAIGACIVRDVDGDGNPEIMTVSNSIVGDELLHQVRLDANGSPKPGQRYVNITYMPLTPWNDASDYTGFGAFAMTNMGDMNGDGFDDIAVGNSTGGTGGEFYLMYLNASGGFDSLKQLKGQYYALDTTLANSGQLGSGIANLGDLDGDGNNDLAVSQSGTNTIWVVLLNKRGLVKSRKRIYSGVNNFVTLSTDARFGWRMAGIGDLDKDGVPDMMAVSSDSDSRGSLWTLFLNSDGSVKKTLRFRTGTGVLDTVEARTGFGSGIDAIGDLDGDGVVDVAVGQIAYKDATGVEIGRVHILFMNSDGTIKAKQVIDRDSSNLGNMNPSPGFGATVFKMGDFNKDGIPDVGATNPLDHIVFPDGFTQTSGICYILNLNGVPVTTGTGDIITNETKDFFAYPNPASDHIVFRGRNAQQRIDRITITDMSGKVIRKLEVQANSALLDVSTFSPGSYIIRLESGDHSQNIRFVKQ